MRKCQALYVEKVADPWLLYSLSLSISYVHPLDVHTYLFFCVTTLHHISIYVVYSSVKHFFLNSLSAALFSEALPQSASNLDHCWRFL